MTPSGQNPSSLSITPSARSNLEGATVTPSGAETRTGFPLPPPIVFGYTPQCAVVVVEGAPVRPFVTEISTMIIIGIVLSVFDLGFFCWLLFTLAVYALPFFAGVIAAVAAYHSGSGVIGAIMVAVLVGAATLAIGQIAFATVRSSLLRAAIGLLYTVPATIAGSLGMRRITAQIAATASSPWDGAVGSGLCFGGIGSFRRSPCLSSYATGLRGPEARPGAVLRTMDHAQSRRGASFHTVRKKFAAEAARYKAQITGFAPTDAAMSVADHRSQDKLRPR